METKIDDSITLGAKARARRFGQSGQTTLEFVMVVIPMLILMLLAIQYLLIWRANSYLEVAAYSAARKFAVNSHESTAEKAAMLYLDKLVPRNAVHFKFSNDKPDFGDPFAVTVSVDYPLLGVPLVQQLFAVETTSKEIWTGPSTSPPTDQDLHLPFNEHVKIIDQETLPATDTWYFYVSYKAEIYQNYNKETGYSGHLGTTSETQPAKQVTYSGPTEPTDGSQLEPALQQSLMGLTYVSGYGNVYLKVTQVDGFHTYGHSIVNPQEYDYGYVIITTENGASSITLTAGAVNNREANN